MSEATNIHEFTEVLRLYTEATKKDMVDVVNRAAKNIAFKSAKYMQRTSKGKIEQELMADNLGAKIVNRDRKAAGLKPLGGKDMEQAVQELIAKRQRSAGYLRAGFGPAIEKFGGHSKFSRKGHVAEGFGTKATGSTLEAVIDNAAIGALSVDESKHVIERAMAETTADMKQYAEKKMSETAKKYSAK